MKLNKEEGKLIIQNIDKILGKSVQKEELEESEQIQPLNEALALGVGVFLRGHRVLNELLLLAMTIFPKDSALHKLAAGLQKPLGVFVNTMDEYWSNHKVLFGVLFTSMLAVDLFGTGIMVAKEKFLQILRKNVAEAYKINLDDDLRLPDPEEPKKIPSKTDTSQMFSSLRKEELDRMQDLAGIKKKVL